MFICVLQAQQRLIYLTAKHVVKTCKSPENLVVVLMNSEAVVVANYHPTPTLDSFGQLDTINMDYKSLTWLKLTEHRTGTEFGHAHDR